MLSKTLHKNMLVYKKIENIYKASEDNFNCTNYQFIAEKLQEEYIKLFKYAKFPKEDKNKKIKEERNLQILLEVLSGARYKDLRLKHKITSEAGIAIIAKTTACNISGAVKKEMALGGSPKRIIKQYSTHLKKIIEQRKKELADV